MPAGPFFLHQLNLTLPTLQVATICIGIGKQFHYMWIDIRDLRQVDKSKK